MTGIDNYSNITEKLKDYRIITKKFQKTLDK